jgi:hypothetical protein
MSRPVCSRCDDHGLVIFEQTVADNVHGDRRVEVAYRCSCPAGAAMSARIAPEPVSPPLYVVPAPRADLDG